MPNAEISRKLCTPPGSTLSVPDYESFLTRAYTLFQENAAYLAPDEDINALELAHLLPHVPETVIAIYLGINDAVCNKGLVTAVLPQHDHNNVFAFDPQIFTGVNDVPSGTIDTSQVLNGFEPPNDTWNNDWTYVMILDPSRTFESLWQEKGYIDMIPAKFEDFTMLSDPGRSRLCTFIDPRAFEHPVNAARPYLAAARDRGEEHASEFAFPAAMEGESDGLCPVMLNRGEKLYVATPDFGPCAHAWNNLHPNNQGLAVVNENSAVPLDLVIAKPPVNPKYKGLIPPKGSADLTTDSFLRGKQVYREPLLKGAVRG